MEVTRREMITAASAIGVTAALAQGIAKADDGNNAPRDKASLALQPRTLKPDHYHRAARIVRHSDPKLFEGFKEKNLEHWALQTTTPHVIRGLYEGGIDTDPVKLRGIYAFTYEVNNISGKHENFRIYVLAGIWRGANKKKLARDTFDAIHNDITTS